MAFVKKNDSFTCRHCGHANPPAEKTCRNHCCHCLWSLHVDLESPGDRASTCHGMMKPTGISGSFPDLQIVHVCTKCGQTRKNKTAVDDNFQEILRLSKVPL